MIDKAAARRILEVALAEDRADELLDCLFAGGMVTVGQDGKLDLVSGDVTAQFMAQLAGGDDD